MGKKKRATRAEPAPKQDGSPFNNPFGALSGLDVKASAPMPELASPAPSEAGASAASSPSAPPARFAGKLVVRRERKGHGGKTVTLLQGLTLAADERTALARELAKALGTGARAAGDEIVVSGDQTERLADWLHRHGATKVVKGS